MKFKTNRQRRAVMAKLSGYAVGTKAHIIAEIKNAIVVTREKPSPKEHGKRYIRKVVVTIK